jgi:hypothetical protein
MNKMATQRQAHPIEVSPILQQCIVNSELFDKILKTHFVLHLNSVPRRYPQIDFTGGSM